MKKMKRYKRHFLCFKCRKNFKQSNEKDLAEKQGDLSLLLNAFYYSKPKKKVSKDIIKYLKAEYFNKKINCPECRSTMVEVPMSFETPAKKKIKKWETLASYHRAKGYIYNNITQSRKELIQLLECSLGWHKKMLQNAKDHRSFRENTNDAQSRIQQNIINMENEILRLKR